MRSPAASISGSTSALFSRRVPQTAIAAKASAGAQSAAASGRASSPADAAPPTASSAA